MEVELDNLNIKFKACTLNGSSGATTYIWPSNLRVKQATNVARIAKTIFTYADVAREDSIKLRDAKFFDPKVSDDEMSKLLRIARPDLVSRTTVLSVQRANCVSAFLLGDTAAFALINSSYDNIRNKLETNYPSTLIL